jgi:hypothetical protein
VAKNADMMSKHEKWSVRTGGLKMKKAAIFDSSVKYGGFCYTSSWNFLGASLLWFVSYPHYFIYYGLILSVDSSRVATAGMRASVEVVLDAVWMLWSMHLCQPHVVGSVRSTPPPTWGFERCMLFEHLSLLYKYAPFAILYLLTAFFHVLQSSEQV